MSKHAMVIDLNRCVRCRTCYVVCKRQRNLFAHPRDENHPYEYYALRFVEWEWGRYPAVRRAFVPVQCMCCDEPLCLRFCPADAIGRASQGEILVNRERCNGCGICAKVCPFGALYIGPDGKADACDLCLDRLEAGLAPKCVEECPAGARFFGDLDNPEGKVAKAVASCEAKPLLVGGVKNTRVYYIPSQNELNWNKLGVNHDFLKAMDIRKRDLPPIKGIV